MPTGLYTKGVLHHFTLVLICIFVVDSAPALWVDYPSNTLHIQQTMDIVDREIISNLGLTPFAIVAFGRRLSFYTKNSTEQGTTETIELQNYLVRLSP